MCLNIMLKKRMNLNTHLYISPSLYSAALFPLFLYVILFDITPTLMYDSPQTITPIFPLVTLPYFASVISFTAVATCFSPPSVLSRVFPLTPPLFCMLFLSPLLPPASPLPLCYTPVSPHPFPYFVSVIPFTHTLPVSHLPMCHTPVFPLAPPYNFCLCYSFHQHSHLYLLSPCASPLSSLLPPSLFCVCYFFHHYSHLNLFSLCVTLCLPSYPSPIVSVLLFTCTPAVSPLPMCHTPVFPLAPLPYIFVSIIELF